MIGPPGRRGGCRTEPRSLSCTRVTAAAANGTQCHCQPESTPVGPARHTGGRAAGAGTTHGGPAESDSAA
eukprot:665498-Hanusia_phi.AAC.2